MSLKGAQIGKEYKVIIEDCCTSGEFISRLIDLKYADEDDEFYLERAEFENGVVLYNDWAIRIEE